MSTDRASPTVLFSARPNQWDEYRPHLTAAFAEAGLAVDLVTEAPAETVDYIIYSPASALEDFRPYTRTKAVLNIWAGVEKIVGNATLTQPLCRMVDPGLTAGMIEWVAGHTLRHHLGMDRHILVPDRDWRNDLIPPLAASRPVGILGLGVLGMAVAEALIGLGFPVRGWSRSPKAAPFPTATGEGGLTEVLRESAILVLLLPQTPATEGLIDAARLAELPEGGVLLNPGRGPLIDDDALIAALDGGGLAHATLDVFRQEPLPQDHPFWAHPKITVTPHVASATRAETASRVLVENIRRGEAGLPFLHQVDRASGY